MRKSFIVVVGGLCAVGVCLGTYLLPVRARQTASPVITNPTTVYTPDTKANRDLHDALLKGNIAKAKAALSAGADPEAVVGYDTLKEPGSPLFFVAAWSSDTPKTASAMVRLLVPKLKNVNLRDERTGLTVLMAAVETGDLPLVKSLVERGAVVDAVTAATDDGGRPYGKETAFYQAVTRLGDHGDDPEPIAVYLLERGANVNHQCADGSTALMRAAQHQKTNTVRLLLSKGANPSLRDRMDFTALRWAGVRGADDVVALLRDRTETNLWEAATLGNAKRVEALLKAGANPNEPRPVPATLASQTELTLHVGDTPLACAAKSDDAATVKALLAAGANASYAHPRTGKTALHTAATYGSNALIPLLLAAGADIDTDAVTLDANNKPSDYRHTQTPLVCAVEVANAETVRLLLKSGVVGSKHDQVNVAFVQLMRSGLGREPSRPHEQRADRVPDDDKLLEAQADILESLLKAGADIEKTGAVVLAVEAGQPGVLADLLQHGASPNAHRTGLSDADETALIAAIREIAQIGGEKEMTKNGTMESFPEDDFSEAEDTADQCLAILLKAGANVSEAAHESGLTPLMVAADYAMPAVIADLIKRGANINAADSEGRTALLRVANAGEDVSTLRWLLKNGAKINHADKEGYTALMLAIDNGDNVAWETYRKENAADIADERKHMRTVHGSEGNEPTRPNDTGHPKLVAALLQSGADKTIVAKDGQTALSLAKRNGFKSVIALLTAPSPKR
ncbi:MAG: ankyrin repeat domain-containing protein [Armatimonadetes bacterium]|nr:ankyrin repeat domain-containing protein [Armatimonadota bacterium]